MPIVAEKRHHVKEHRSLTGLLGPLDELTRTSSDLFAAHIPYQDQAGASHVMPKYWFAGPGDRGSYLRVGIFAGIHGDEESGVLAVAELIRRLEANPELARGYEIFFYPVCNRRGYLDNTRWSLSGLDLNREFWKGSEEKEVQVLEHQLRQLNFDGIIALHDDDTSEGLYGFVKGHSLTRHVLEPALEAAGKILPRNFDKSIDNFDANNGIIEQGYEGILSSPPDHKPKPFEIVFETPHHADLNLQVEAHVVAILTILDRFKVLISEAQNI